MIRGLWAFLVLIVTTTVLGLLSTVVSLLFRRSHFVSTCGKLWSRSMLWATGARVSYSGLEHARSTLPCLFVCNHQSNADIWALYTVLPETTRFVAKRSLFRVPVMGWAMRSAGFIPVDRGNRSKAIQSLSVAAERVRSGFSLMLFPEGTRSKDGKIAPFKKGAFHLALEAGVPVVPVAISGSWKLLPPGTMQVRPGPVQVRFLPPVEVGAYGPGEHMKLLEKVHGIIREALEGSGEPAADPAVETEAS